ncbi:MAG: hypothetical protein ACOVMG_03690 [Flavobacterium sp.]
MSTTNKGKVGLPMNPQKRHKLFNFKNTRIGGLIGVFLLFATLFSITGCNKDEILNTQSKLTTKSAVASSEISLPEIRNNRLYFASVEALQEFTNSLNQFQDYDALNQRLKNAGFISYYYFQNTTEEEQKSIVVENKEFNDMPDDKLKTILNVNQEIQIDNVICRLQNDYGFIFEEKNRALVSEFSALKPSFEEVTSYKDEVIAFKINVKENVDDGIMRKSVSIGGYGWKTQNSINEYVRDVYRVRGHHWATNVFFYKSFGVATYHEKRILSGWWIFKSWSWKPWNAEDVKLKLKGSATFRGYNAQGNQVTQSNIPYNLSYNIHQGNKVVHDFDTRWQVGVTVGGGAGMSIPIVNYNIPFSISGVKTNFSLDLDWLDTDHQANYVNAPSLKWKW